ncbi:MAG: S8 family peptidase [Alphaproteobacteria bacterium]|nr:S8 family peptidase [Alphaproteobacteria bacterium]
MVKKYKHLNFNRYKELEFKPGSTPVEKPKISRPDDWHLHKKNELEDIIKYRNKPIKASITFHLSDTDMIDKLSTGDIRLLSVKEDENSKLIANVQFKNEKSYTNFYKNKLYDYSSNKPRPFSYKIDKIEDGVIDTLITDIYPKNFNDDNLYWFEFWLVNEDNENYVDIFLEYLTALKKQLPNLLFNKDPLDLIDRRLVYAKTSKKIIEDMIINNCNYIAEIKFAKRLKTNYVDVDIEEKQQMDLSVNYNLKSETRTCAVILDTGVNLSNHFLKDIISNEFALSIKKEWGTYDNDFHGTAVAGLVLFGDFHDLIDKSNPINVSHKVCSVKVYNPNNNDDEYTIPSVLVRESMQMVEHTDCLVNYNKCYVSSNTTQETLGDPSSYSIDLDFNIFDNKILFLISVGNYNESFIDKNIYKLNHSKAYIEDPSQSWNSLSIGAYTEKYTKLEDDYTPLYEHGDISPNTRFKNKNYKYSNLPLKPEILFEGGNKAYDSKNTVLTHDALDLLTANASFAEDNHSLRNFNGTSASVALAGRFASILMEEYPDFWPETIRALMIHSAEYTDFIKNREPKAKIKYLEFLHRYSYGIPNLDKARESANNLVTLVSQREFEIFKKVKENNSEKTLNKSILFDLPWPQEVLRELGNLPIILKVTLSYFIKPKAGSTTKLNINKFKYQSHGFRFDLKNHEETYDQFIKRVTHISEKEGIEKSQGIDNWKIGIRGRSKISGSVSKDIWEGKAIELADMDKLIVYPVYGWWKEDKKTKEVSTRFSLIMSIETDNEDIDLYNEVRTIIETTTPITIK